MPLNLRSKPKITSNFNPSSKSKRPNPSISNQTSKSPLKSAQNRQNSEKSAPNRSQNSHSNTKSSFLAPVGRIRGREREKYGSEDDFGSRNRTRSGARQWERKNIRSRENRELGDDSDRKSDRIVREKERVGFDRDRRKNGREFEENDSSRKNDRILRGKERYDKEFYEDEWGGKEGRKVRERVVWKKGVEVRCEESEEEEVEEVVEEKREKFQSRVLVKTGRKIRINRKEKEGSSSVEGSVKPKKKKRVIKIDPYDFSNKRLDDSPVAENEKVIEKKEEMSMNAQFRAIQPSPDVLSFVEENLLGRRRLIELQNAGYNTKISAPLDNVPFSESKERERIEDNVFRNKLEFFAAAKISSSFPPPVLPEIAFAGRSNVGKSSLLNALTRQWGVVRTSDKPGLTQTINFFRLASKLSLVDLPGYGFAYAKEEVKDAWEELAKEYVSTRVGLQQVCLLIDTKWGMKARDHELVELMERSKTPYQIVLTKTDLVFPIDVARRAMQIQQDLKSNKSLINPVTMVSSKSGAGIRNLRGVLSKLARFVKP